MKQVKVALIGPGHLGKWHLEKAKNLKEAQLIGIVEPLRENNSRVQEKYPTLKVVTQLEDIMNDIEAALVISPTETHFEICKILLEQGKHVFCEKPLCTTYEETQYLAQLARKKKLILQVGHSERCHRCWEEGRKKFPDFFHHPTYINIKRVAPFKGRATDVDVVMDLMIHDIDLCLYLFARRPLSVSAIGAKTVTQHLDFCKATFLLENNIRVDIEVARNSRKEERFLEILGAKGWLHFDLLENSYTHSFYNEKIKGTENKKRSYPPRDHLEFEQALFYESILRQKPPFVSGEDGSKAVYLLEKVLASVRTQTKVVL